MNYHALTNQEIMLQFNESMKEYKLFQIYLQDVNDDHEKIKVAKLKFENAKHKYEELLQEMKKRDIHVERDMGIIKMIFEQ